MLPPGVVKERLPCALVRGTPGGSTSRCGEIFGLRWSDVADDNRTLTVERSNIDENLTDPKTESGSRTVPLFPTARKALLEHRMASPFKDAEDLVFPDELGRPVDAQHHNDCEFRRR